VTFATGLFCEEPTLSFGDFEIKSFAGGIRMTDRNQAIAFIMTLQPNHRIRKAAERALWGSRAISQS
jgi:hypothetical protein